MPLEPGAELGPYRITGPLGAGGMGEVYRATDTKLHRDVAIKVLPDAFASDEQRMKRFEREAQVLASLNHPNIAAIYGLEGNALVLELVEGPTLAERIREGPIPLEEAIAIARQIVDALSEAHEKGIIHRDLKPANVKLTEADQVKVLDFGLAKALSDGSDGADADRELSQSPTLTRQATMAGMILGTAAYMSPEQAKGKRVDRRADVWAFGAVLYEMLTGKRAFEGEDVSETLAAVLRAEPDMGALPKNTPVAIRRLFSRLFRKNPRERLGDIGDARFELEEALATPEEASAKLDTPQPSGWLALAGVALGAIVTFALSRPPAIEAPPITRYAITARAPDTIDGHPALSPDGRLLVYGATRDGVRQLFRRGRGELEATPIPDTEGAEYPFFSPDGVWVGFFADDSLKKVPMSGGPAQTICRAGVRNGASWGEDGTIVFVSSAARGIQRVSSDGGEASAVTAPGDDEPTPLWPELLPGGESLLFTMLRGASTANKDVAVLSLATGETRVLLEGTGARYTPSGHLVFGREGALWAAPFDPERASVTGEAVPVVDGVQVNTGGGYAFFSVARDGTLAYKIGVSATHVAVNFVDRDGVARPLLDEPGDYGQIRYSPDGSRIAVELEADIWIADPSRRALSRITVNGGRYPIWTSDGSRITFVGPEDGIYRISADGSGEAERLLGGQLEPRLGAWSPDGETLMFWNNFTRIRMDLLTLRDGAVETFRSTPFPETDPELSPDGGWLLYVAQDTGEPEVYLEPYAGPGERIRVSLSGGRQPSWSRDGREIYFRSPDGHLMVAAFDAASPRVGRPEALFAVSRGRLNLSGPRYYDPAPDGSGFAMLTEPEAEESEIHVVLNWLQELAERVPTR